MNAAMNIAKLRRRVFEWAVLRAQFCVSIFRFSLFYCVDAPSLHPRVLQEECNRICVLLTVSVRDPENHLCFVLKIIFEQFDLNKSSFNSFSIALAPT